MHKLLCEKYQFNFELCNILKGAVIYQNPNIRYVMICDEKNRKKFNKEDNHVVINHHLSFDKRSIMRRSGEA